MRRTRKGIGYRRRGIDRREFIALLGGTAASLTLVGCNMDPRSFNAPDVWNLEEEEWVATTCQQCPGRCGMIARLVDGNLKAVAGNPLHPVSRGGLCSAGHSAIQLLYHPERLRSAMRNDGEKGSGNFVVSTGDQEITTLAAKLADLRANGEPQGLAYLCANRNDLRYDLASRFMEAYGSPHLYVSSENIGQNQVFKYMQGIDGTVGYDLENANYVLSFGADIVGNLYNPVSMARTYGFLRQERIGKKAQITQVESRLSVAGTRADNWVPLNVGTEGALAMGIAYIIIKEEKYNSDFIERHTFGFEDWVDENGKQHVGYRNLVLINYGLEVVSEITGVPVEQIITIAKDFARHQPSVAVFDDAIRRRPNGTFTGMAIHALNGLMGSFEDPGGVVVQTEVPFTVFPSVERDAIAEAGLKTAEDYIPESGEIIDGSDQLEAFITRYAGRKDHGIKILILDNVNPVLTSPERNGVIEFIKSIPLVVSLSQFTDETSSLADILIPNHHFLERWDASTVPSVSGHAVMSLTQPIVDPFYDTTDSIDLFIRLAKEIGGTVASAFQWEDSHDAVKDSVEGLYKARRGGVFDITEKEEQLEQLQRRGWWYPEFTSYSKFWDAALKRGGWWDPYYARGEWWRVLRTPSGRFEFSSNRLRELFDQRIKSYASTMNESEILKEIGLGSSGDLLYMPHYEEYEIDGVEDENHFVANPFRTLSLMNGERANQPWMQEAISPLNAVKWGTWIEISPPDAERLGIAFNDTVRVTSSAGSMELVARIYKGVVPGVVNIPMGQGHNSYGKWADNIGVNPNDILVRGIDPVSGMPSWLNTRVQLELV